MKKKSKLFLVATILFFGLLIYLKYFASAGADGLSTFFPTVVVLVLFVCSLIAFLFSFFTNSIKIPILIIALGAFGCIATLLYFSFDYTSQHKEQIENKKKWIKTKSFKNIENGIAFQHVSGTINAYTGNTPIVNNIHIAIENETIYVPSEFSYSPSDIIRKELKNSTISLKKHLKKTFSSNKVLLECDLKKVNNSNFKNLPNESEIYKIEFSGKNENCRKAIVNNWLPNYENTPEEIFFISKSEKANSYLIILINSPMFSISANVSKMGSSDVKDKNKWYNTIYFL
ncbi:hypothetical protein CLV91_1770 [Maribacter vaceletii]|uniref:Uncharacterized protein n=1 Tax=Maribacter vaceletii TaxID=1206816 RepID=A0A495E8C4_9FLAO|nr:hypothetical protein [Maribacter vaceletii]RKR13056.1 hypothetical protein CLV91_1770 [Maribacter vaceletii]